MAKQQSVIGLEINPKFVGALFTEQVDETLHVFCFYLNGEISKFDLPAQENLDNLQHFFSRLNIDPTCSSMVLDEVVQGRFYVRSQTTHWLYTLLASPGNLLPLHDTNICDLPWKMSWHSQEADILECGQPGEPLHCFAIRTAITEDDSSRLVKQSKAFINPLPVRKKRSHRRLYLNIGVGLACVGIPLALTLFYAMKPIANASPEPAAAQIVVRSQPSASQETERYYLLYRHQITGPYALKTISDMKTGGLLDANALCRTSKSTDWVSLNSLLSPANGK